jgi:FlaA1/EpsC-like NDP-sugar epimerase
MSAFLLRLRNRQFFFLDMLMLAILPMLAFGLRMDGFGALSRFAGSLSLFTLLAMVIHLLIFYWSGLYHRYWRYASVNEIVLIATTVGAASAVNTLLFFALRLLPVCTTPITLPCVPGPLLPRSIPFINALLTFVVVGGSRFSVRLVQTLQRRGRSRGTRMLVIGAGDAGLMIAREVQNNPQLGLQVVGFVDDDAAKQGMKIQGVPVLGGREHIPQLVRSLDVSQAVIAMPTAPGKTIRKLVEICEKAGVRVKTIPGIYELLSGQVSVSQIRDIEIEDLLRREPVHIETDEIARMLKGKRILVTGAGGSIGLEICRQVAYHGASELVMLGHGENSIFRGLRELQAEYPHLAMQAVIGDVRDKPRLEIVFSRHNPQIVFHAAAHKHVSLMEANPEDAVTNNILGTKYLVEAAEQVGVERFVLVSTDKAVNPSSTMGATKRVAELLIEAAALRHRPSAASGEGVYLAVRFGNVLGSRGSVVEVFREQIARGGPITITDPEMKRYFMTAPEAVQLVLQAAAIGQGGDIFVLDMGEPVRIVDLAHDLVELSGLQVGRDIDFEYVGSMPGEKLFEELFAESEAYIRTAHEKCFVVRNGVLRAGGGEGSSGAAAASRKDLQGLDENVQALLAAAQAGDRKKVTKLLMRLVPEYHPAQ